MKNNKFDRKIGTRLKDIRESLDMTLQQVTKLMGFSNYQTLSSIESGERPIKAHELHSLAKIYFIDVESILLGEDMKPVKVLWRAKADSPAVKEKEKKFLSICQNYYLFEQKCKETVKPKYKDIEFSRKDLDYEIISRKAESYVKAYGLGKRPACCLRSILEDDLGVKIIYLNLENVGSGASVVANFGASILINNKEAPWRRNYDLAHELFHILTWDIVGEEEVHCGEGEKSQVEKFADVFASSLLLPKTSLIEEIDKRVKNGKVSFIDCINIAREFGVSIEALLYRLVVLKRLQKDKVEKCLKKGIIKIIDRKMRNQDWTDVPILSERYIFLAFKCFQKGLISKGKLAEYLQVDRDNLAEFLLNKGYDLESECNIEFTNTRQ